MSAIEYIQDKFYTERSAIEYCIVEAYEVSGLELVAEQAAAELAAKDARIAKLEKLLSRADVAFRCDLTQPDANDYYWRVRQDITEVLK